MLLLFSLYSWTKNCMVPTLINSAQNGLDTGFQQPHSKFVALIKYQFINSVFYKQFAISMNFLKQAKSLIKSHDLFFSTEMLRYEDAGKYRTLTGGIISLGITITIIIGFASMILDTLQLSAITTNLKTVKQTDPTHSVLSTSPDSMFMFGVEIWKLNFSDSARYFDITFKSVLQSGQQTLNTTYIPLEACTKEHWAQFPDILQNFQKLQMGGWLCPKINQTFQLFGKYSSDIYNQYIITLSACTNESSAVPCAPQSQIDQLYVDNSDFFYFTFYFTNPVINPGSKDYKKYYLQDENYVIFGNNIGSETFIYFADYTIKTDYSIWPFSDINTDSGCIVKDLAINHPFQVSTGPIVTLNIAKSADSLIYTRTVSKISSVVSFMGGLIGAASTLLFIIRMYTKLSFQISIAFSLFKPSNEEQQQQPLSQKRNNLWTFFKLQAIKFCQYFGIKVKWPSMDYMEQCQSQILRQLDIKALLKRIIFFQHCLTFIFEDYQLQGLQLKKPNSVRQIRNIREKFESLSIDADMASAQQSSDASNKQQISNDILRPTTLREQPNFQETIGYQQFTGIGPKTQHKNQRRNGIIQDQLKKKPTNKFNSILEIQTFGHRRQQQSKDQCKNEDKKEQKQKSCLRFLQQSAQEGNIMSKKILENLEPQKKEQDKKGTDTNSRLKLQHC